MCLSTITKTIDHPLMKIEHGWKEFKIKPCQEWTKRAHFKINFSVFSSKRLRVGRWMKASRGSIICKYSPIERYPKGFHYYTHKGRPVGYSSSIYVSVEVRRVHTHGTQNRRKVNVAYELRVPKDWMKYLSKRQRSYYRSLGVKGI